MTAWHRLGLALAIASAACSSDSTNSGADAPDGAIVCARSRGGCTPLEIQYVVDRITLATTSAQAAELALDLNGDDRGDNLLGSQFAVAEYVDADAATDRATRTGEIIHLLALSTSSVATATGVGFTVLRGADPSIEPCAGPDDDECGRHLTGAGHFVATDDPSSPFVGDIIAGRLTAELAGETHVEIRLTDTSPVLRVPFAAATVDATVTAERIEGRIGGAILDADYREVVLPALVSMLNEVMAQDCELSDACVCEAGSTGELVAQVFDSDSSCSISVEEVLDVPERIPPDLDLFDANGVRIPDGVRDSWSLAFGFTAVPATFDQ